MPITQVRMRPCDLLPGISILASRPAARPRTIQAMMPITDSLVSDEVTYAVVSHAWLIAMGVEFSRDSYRPLACSVLPAPFRARKKIPDPCATAVIVRLQLPGSGASSL